MGCLLSTRRPAITLAIVGLPSAGKTTLYHRLNQDRYVYTEPTRGFNYSDTVRLPLQPNGSRVQCALWDMGARRLDRQVAWQQCARDADALIFVVDSVDAAMNEWAIEEARHELHRMSSLPEHAGTPVLLLANKQDLLVARPPADLAARLGLSDLRPPRPVACLGVCAVNGDGLAEALDSLRQLLANATVRKRRGRSALRG